jgi:hypothetical protein
MEVCVKQDASQMAAEFLRLWQQQITKSMTDPATIRSMLESMQMMYGAAPATEKPHDAPTRRPAPAPDADGDALRVIHARIGKLEQSVAKLSARLDAAEKPNGTRHGRDDKRVAANKRATKPARKPVAKRRKPAAKRKKAKTKQRRK